MKRKPKSALENQIFWVYALIAFSESSNKKACYIGQTVNLLRRLKVFLTALIVGPVCSLKTRTKW
jgi:hypothetical protein